jgi:5-methylcytosine-specific restriction endonuclease McrA
MTERRCSMPECTQQHRAKGLCSTHYNQGLGEAARHPKQLVACVVCATSVRRRKDSEDRYLPTCSVACRTMVAFGRAVSPTSGYAWRTDAVQRARKHGAPVIEVFDREDVFDRDAWLCQDCGIHCAAPNPFDRTAATVDHVVPLHLGGDHSKANAQTLCLSCNARKADRLDISPAA